MSNSIPPRISFTINWQAVKECINILYAISKGLKKKEVKHGKRKRFSKKTQDLTLLRQNSRCADCGEHLWYPEFHHIGDRSDNSLANCEALCPNCHAKKTRKKS
ncbi:MAG: hypothetical protein NPMRTH1_480009 [Nitrosopumilales archaeon]|nr:MAG: hypothetical protein NPMRTH1_480009 [Nitrosopumilales archaeon]